MSHDLTLPGTIPGLLRKCSPVMVPMGTQTVPRVVIEVGEGRNAGYFGCEPRHWYTPDVITLDLTDATGRAHAAWWLALREVPQPYHLDPAAVSWSPAPAQASRGWAIHWLARAPSGGGSLTGTWWTGSRDSPVPSDLLADLDRDDDRRLPDGSRWVDAEALRRVVLHVAGVPA